MYSNSNFSTKNEEISQNRISILAVVRTRNESTVLVNDEKMKIPYPVEVQAILDEFAYVFPKDLLGGLPPSRELDHRIELVPRAEPPHRPPCCKLQRSLSQDGLVGSSKYTLGRLRRMSDVPIAPLDVCSNYAHSTRAIPPTLDWDDVIR